MGLFRKRKQQRPMTPAELEAHRAEVHAHLAVVAAARAAKAGNPIAADIKPGVDSGGLVVKSAGVGKKTRVWIRDVPTRIAVAGTTKYQVGIARAMLATYGEEALRNYEGDEFNILVTLRIEPTNPYDPKAIQVICEGQLLGYIPRDHTAWTHKTMGSPANREADVSALVVTYSDQGDGESLGVIIPEQTTPQ